MAPIIFERGFVMKIIKEGRKAHRFKCSNCGCIFEADRDEFSVERFYANDDPAWITYKAECPWCHEDVIMG